MNIYPLIRPLLFSLDAEQAHDASLKALNLAHATGLSGALGLTQPVPNQAVTVMGLSFSNPLGLAAGMDKNGDYIDALGSLGFGFLEVGTVTPRPQAGNPKPRLFRLPEHQAIINRMGFNNLGIEHLLQQVPKRRYTGILGINIGKNADVAMDDAIGDYLIGLRKAYQLADYISINISSPNTQNLRQLQQADQIKKLLQALKTEQLRLQLEFGKYTPIAIKIAPDLSDEEIAGLARVLLEYAMDGVIATNTTLDRGAVTGHPLAKENGGLSGVPVKDKAGHVLEILASELDNRLPIIAVGGINSAEAAQQRLQAGASLLQIYTSFIYQGPAIIKQILTVLSRR